MNCPVCNNELKSIDEQNSVEIYWCTTNNCGGWFSIKQLENITKNYKLARNLRNYISPLLKKIPNELNNEFEGKMKCPDCSSPMVSLNLIEYRKISVNGCMVCQGRWANKNVVLKLTRFNAIKKLLSIFK